MEKTITVFSYGSNMLTARIQERVPSAKAIGIGQLKEYALKWHKSSKDKSGKCDIQLTRHKDDSVQGVLFELLKSEKPKLDKVEGLGHGYEGKMVSITTDGNIVDAHVYFATNIDRSLKPYNWYKKIVVAGATEHGLDRDYIAALEAIVSKPDTDADRAAKNLKTLSIG